ncbi:MAG: hypothetical protein OXG85_07385 [Chloroflexi bacterium]|nr:hypothetical protein [Chloroflexota bacterium]
MAYDRRKIANSFSLPKHPFLRGIASLMDFTGSRRRELEKQILERSDADAMRADWEAVGASLWWAIGKYEKNLKKDSVSE